MGNVSTMREVRGRSERCGAWSATRAGARRTVLLCARSSFAVLDLLLLALSARIGTARAGRLGRSGRKGATLADVERTVFPAAPRRFVLVSASTVLGKQERRGRSGLCRGLAGTTSVSASVATSSVSLIPVQWRRWRSLERSNARTTWEVRGLSATFGTSSATRAVAPTLGLLRAQRDFATSTLGAVSSARTVMV